MVFIGAEEESLENLSFLNEQELTKQETKSHKKRVLFITK